jgi:shikimate kinase
MFPFSRSTTPSSRGTMLNSQSTKRHLILVGFSGSGKSTLGPLLAKRLKRQFFDTDAIIEQMAKKSVTEIFRTKGEAYFRTLERKAIMLACKTQRPSIIALGGGALLDKRNLSLAQTCGTVIYLRCSLRELIRRLKHKTDRPLLKGATALFEWRIRDLFRTRRPGYELADITVSVTASTRGQIIARITQRIER